MLYEVITLLVLSAFVLMPRAETGTPQEVRIGLLAKRGSKIDVQLWEPTADYLTAQLPGYHFHMVPLDFNQIHEAVLNERIA